MSFLHAFIDNFLQLRVDFFYMQQAHGDIKGNEHRRENQVLCSVKSHVVLLLYATGTALQNFCCSVLMVPGPGKLLLLFSCVSAGSQQVPLFLPVCHPLPGLSPVCQGDRGHTAAIIILVVNPVNAHTRAKELPRDRSLWKQHTSKNSKGIMEAVSGSRVHTVSQAAAERELNNYCRI